MSFRDCITGAQAEGAITEKQAKEARDLFDDLEAEYQGKMAPGSASYQAGLDAMQSLERQALERKRKKLLSAQAWKKISMDLEGYRDPLGRQNPYSAALAVFDQDVSSRFSSVSQRKDAIAGQAFGEMSQFLATFRRNLLGEVRQKATLKNMAREVFGESTGDASAHEMAQAWMKASENLRKRYNRAGGAIPKRENWGLPQRHDWLKVARVPYAQWRDAVLPKLDVAKMVDEVTGLPFSGERLELALKDVYETISTEGFSKTKGQSAGRGKSLANRRQDHRFLAFKDADSWLAYQKQFGDDNVFDTMISHIETMSRDIALMEILGPNPTSTVNSLKHDLHRRAALTKDPAVKNKATKTAYKIDELYHALTGASNAPISASFAATMAGTRQVLQSAQLGAASLSAITTDPNFQRTTRKFAGLPQTRMLKQYLDHLNPLSAKEKGELAIRLGLIAEGWTSLAAGQARFVGDISGPEVTRRVADFVMRASFLSPMTTAGRWAFGMEFLGTLADNSGKAFRDLDPNFRNTFERYGLGEGAWDIIRATELYDADGAKFLRPADIAARTDLTEATGRELATRLLEIINTETNFAVPSTSLRGRVALVGETRPGTISGELTRSFAMYKNFGVTLMNTHIMRGMTVQGGAGKGAYYAGLIVSTTLMGALALQLKEMAKGRDPRDMFGDSAETAKFWTSAMMQGGGLGIFGDFLYSGTNRYGSGLAQTVAGPAVGFVDDTLKLTVGNAYEMATGRDTNMAGEMVKFTQRYTPGSSLWYSRLALERLVFDQLTLMADPKAKSKMRRTESKYKTEFGQKYWWSPGDTSPSRAPDIGAAFGR